LTEICDPRIQELVSELELEIGPEHRCVIDVGVRRRSPERVRELSALRSQG
jgi:hypothetical protein